MAISGRTKICMIIGDPVAHSLSPLLHNTGYETLGIQDQYVFVANRVARENLAAAIAGIRALGIWGISCTMPHKESVLFYLDKLDCAAEKIGAVNTILNDNGSLVGFNTDWLGIIRALSNVIDPKGIKVAILGAGGTARAAAFGLTEAGAEVTIFNRSIERARELGQRFNCGATDLNDPVLADAEVVINTTSVESPIDVKHRLTHCQVALDVNYRDGKSHFLREAETRGIKIINGEEVFIEQGLAQFEIYTGRKAPSEEMIQAIGKGRDV